MDQGTQEEVEPVFSYTEKFETVKQFIKSRYTITDHEALKNIIDRSLVKPLIELRDFRTEATGNYGLTFKHYRNEDAKAYFEYLIAIVAGTEKVESKYFKEAVEQLFTFLYFMRPNMTIEKDPFATPSIEKRLDLLATKLDIISSKQIYELFTHLETRDTKFLEIFEILKQWMHAYKEPLEQAKEYFAGRIRKTEGKD